MKKKILKTTMFFTVAVILTGCNSKNSQDDTFEKKAEAMTASFCINFINEDFIDLTGYIKPYSEVQPHRTAFETAFRYFKDVNNDGVETADEYLELAKVPTVISMQAILDLYNKVKSTPSNLTGLDVKFGLTGDKIEVLFTPMTLKCGSPSTLPGIYEYAPLYYNTTYTYNPTNNSLDPVSAAYLAQSRQEYKSKIRISHKDGEPYGSLHEEPGSWSEDTKSVIFSFQEIFRFYYMLFPCNAGQSDHLGDLYIYSGAARYELVGNTNTNDYRNKHNVFITCEDLEKSKDLQKVRTLFVYNDAANLAHLCPPSCFPSFKVLNKKPCLGL